MAPRAAHLKGITKRFPGTLANDQVDLTVEPGTIHALLGENGAGKTTLMNILSGRYRPDEGEILLGDTPVRFRSTRDALRAGIGMVHQHFMLVATHTVAENLALGMPGDRVLLHPRALHEAVRRLADAYRLPVEPEARIEALSLGQQQRVEILKLLHRQADVLILDEPTAVLTPTEIDALFETLRRIAGEGRAVIFITHKLDEVMEIADRITILRRGRRVAELTPGEVESRRELARLMVGREVVLQVDKPPIPPGEVVLQLRDCSALDPDTGRGFERVSLTVRRGEIVSIVGVAGNGQTELVRAITGALPLRAGRGTALGAPLGAPRREPLGYVPEDRQHVGAAGALDLVDNALLTTYPAFCRTGFLRRAAARRHAAALLDRFHVSAPGPQVLARQLSGGNLQKLILGRELSRGARLIVAEQPTRGLDIGATMEVWKALVRQREHAGILLVSGDLTEILSLSDRVVVLFRGRVMGTLTPDDEEAIAEIGPMMAGVRHG